MAKLEKQLYGDMDTIAERITKGILDGSVSATLEDCAGYRIGDARCTVRVFERYSHAGGNRVSMNVTLFQSGDSPIQLCAITSGGSQAMFWKLNTLGEETFLESLKDVLRGM